MSLRNLLRLGRRLVKSKTEPTTIEPIRTTTVSGLQELPKSLTVPSKVKLPETVAEQSKALVAKDPQIQAPPFFSPMNNNKNTVINTGKVGVDQNTFEQRRIFGSVAYDRIAQKGDGMFTADEWADWLTDRGKRKFKLFGKDFEDGYVAGAKFKYDTGFAKGTHLLNKEQQVPLEELFDSNIATFNRQGDLTGGLLGAAKEAGVKLPGRVLADMAMLNPANRIKIVELGVPGQILTKSENVIAQQISRVRSMEKSLERASVDLPIGDEIASREAKNHITKLKDEFRSLRENIKNGYSSAIEDNASQISMRIAALKQGAGTQQKIALNQMQGEVDDLVASAKNVRTPKYTNQAGYTFPGGQNYREAILVLDETIPGNKIGAGRRSNPHYDGEEYKNPLAHIRWDTRTTSDGKKAFLISEIQSDTNQGLARYLREQGQEALNTPLRSNPYQNDIIVNYLSASRKKLSDEIIGGKLRPAQIEMNANKIRKIDEKIKELGKQSDVEVGRYGDVVNRPQKLDYFPLLDRSSQARAAMSYLSNIAAKEGVDYIAIAPTNLMTRGMGKGKTKAYQEFYGYPRGNKTPGSKSLAVIPDLMKKMGKEFDTKAGVIKVSKSDPTKPYKSLDEYSVPVEGDQAYQQIAHKEAVAKQTPGYEYIPDNDLRLYTDVFSVKVSPNMLKPQKLYKKEGGFISKYN